MHTKKIYLFTKTLSPKCLTKNFANPSAFLTPLNLT